MMRWTKKGDMIYGRFKIEERKLFSFTFTVIFLNCCVLPIMTASPTL
jgi:hypothetical protein